MKTHEDIVFVYGALRSGTTVFRLMLDTHPAISNPGEMDFLFDFLKPDSSHPTGWRYDLDGLRWNRIFKSSELELPPGCDGLDLLDSFLAQLNARAPGQVLSINLHRHMDRVFAILPHVRVLHMLRDPRDVARSSIQIGWVGTLYHGVSHWIDTETAWDVGTQGVSEAQILEITYEGLFRDITGTLQRVCAFLDVEFLPEMLRYHENTTYGPPDVNLTEQWKRKCAPRELAELEARAGPLMEKRGYALSQNPRNPGVMRRIVLATRGLLYRWRFGMKRYGVVTYWAEKVSRWIGLTGANRRIRKRMDAIVIQHLK